jgi:uncharacterized protein YcbX
VIFQGEAAWEELDWVDRVLRMGSATVRCVRRTRRCAATNVDPATAVRDLEIPATLLRSQGHADLGVYVEVLEPGRIAPGDRIEFID